MKVQLAKIPTGLHLHVEMELMCYEIKKKNRHIAEAWRHLHRAHLISQKYPGAHFIIHLRMLKFAIQTFSIREIGNHLVQLPFCYLESAIQTKQTERHRISEHPYRSAVEMPEDLERILGYYTT